MNTLKNWMRYWQKLPAINKIGAAVCFAALIACIVALAFQVSGLASDIGKDIGKDIRKPKPEAVKDSPWSKTQPLLEHADHRAAQLLEERMASIHAFLDERKAGCRAFAQRMLSLRGKWEALRSLIGDNTGFLQEAFAEQLFQMDELKKVVDSAVLGYLAELESIDDDLLVRLRADLADDALPSVAIPALGSEQAFHNHYHELRQRVAEDMRTDLAVVAGRELFSQTAGNIATNLTMQVGAALAARLGISTTILAVGAESAWETCLIGLAVSFLLDAVIDRIIKAAGYDAEARIAQRIEEILSNLGRTITDGDPAARVTLDSLKRLHRDDPQPEIRAACAEAIRSIEAGAQLHGLRGELTKISAARASLRKETLRRLLQQSR